MMAEKNTNEKPLIFEISSWWGITVLGNLSKIWSK
jgi:hypothetical protein